METRKKFAALGEPSLSPYVSINPRYYSSPSNKTAFGLEGMAFITEFGIMVPISHPSPPRSENIKDQEIAGQKVVVLDPLTGNYTDFI